MKKAYFRKIRQQQFEIFVTRAKNINFNEDQPPEIVTRSFFNLKRRDVENSIINRRYSLQRDWRSLTINHSSLTYQKLLILPKTNTFATNLHPNPTCKFKCRVLPSSHSDILVSVNRKTVCSAPKKISVYKNNKYSLISIMIKSRA